MLIIPSALNIRKNTWRNSFKDKSRSSILIRARLMIFFHPCSSSMNSSQKFQEQFFYYLHLDLFLLLLSPTGSMIKTLPEKNLKINRNIIHPCINKSHIFSCIRSIVNKGQKSLSLETRISQNRSIEGFRTAVSALTLAGISLGAISRRHTGFGLVDLEVDECTARWCCQVLRRFYL